MTYQWKKEEKTWKLLAEDQAILALDPMEGCQDTFEPLGEGAYRWTRKCAAPVDHMKLTVRSLDPLRYWQVPSVNYNGNGWGSGAQYSGFGVDGEPWVYAWHRVAIPACSYAESEKWAVSLFGEEKGGMSGSIWEEDGKACQALIWPEQETPKVLFKRCWMPPFQGTMAPQSEFSAILYVTPAKEIRESYHDLMDFAWKYFQRDVKMRYAPEQVTKLDTLYFRSMYRKLFDGVTGFSAGRHWVESEHDFVKSNGAFEMGWVGQNIAISCLLMDQYLKTGDEDLKVKALNVLDSWIKYGQVGNGLMYVKLVCDPSNVDSITNGDIPITFDANGLGVGATYFFWADKLAAQCGEKRPE